MKFEQPTQVADGVWLLPLPIEMFIPSNAYLIEDKELTIIDSGHPPAIIEGVFDQMLTSIGYKLEDVKQIIYTHHHIDHSGGGILLSRRHKMKHLISEVTAPALLEADEFYNVLRFMPQSIAKQYPVFEEYVCTQYNNERYFKSHPYVGRLEGTIQPIKAGDIINLGKRKLQVVSTPGHHIDDLVLIDSDNGIAFTGDAMLNWEVLFAFVVGASVGNYLQSLDDMENAGRGVKLILPGHGDPMNTDFIEFITKTRQTILDRVEEVYKYLQINGSTDARTIFETIYHYMLKNPSWPEFFCTTISYLLHLETHGRVREVKAGVWGIV